MPRPPSSDRFVRTPDLGAQAGASRSEESTEPPKVAPLIGRPDYLSITWLASRVNLYGKVPHLSPSGTMATLPVGQGATFAVYRTQDNNYVIKRPLVLFQQSKGEEDVFKQLYSLHLELRVLTDSRFRSHPNIVKLLTVIWEEHPDDIGHYWPSLILENAKLGSLSDYFRRGERPSLNEQQNICYGVGSGLEFLHQHGVVHGDVKCDNILLFRSDGDKGIIPKLGDFGYAVLDGENTPLLGLGTHPFKAPELYNGEISRSDIIYTDIYSFGLLIWQVSQDGHNPFEAPNVCPHHIFSIQGKEHIQTLKETDRVLDIAISSLSGQRSSFRRALELTIKSAPLTRKLKDALQALRSGMLEDGAGTTDSPKERAIAGDGFNLREMRHLGHLGMSIQKQILLSLERRTDITFEGDNEQRSAAAMIIAASCLEEFGGRKSKEALKWILLAASLGNQLAMSHVYRISKALGLYEDKSQILNHLIESARAGSDLAIEDLLIVCPKKGREVLGELEANLRIHYLPFPDLKALKEYIRDHGPSMHEPIRNSRGDSLIHLAACSGDVAALRLILEQSNGSAEHVNAINYLGQTPLLSSLVAGEFASAMTLLNHGADASKADNMGDTTFHWLYLFNGRQMEELADALLKQNCNVNAITLRQQWDSDYQVLLLEGTPLHRAIARNKIEAVKVLLKCGADPLLPGRGHELSTPLWIACTFHNFEILELLLKHIGDAANVKKIVNGGESELWPLHMPVFDIQYYFLNGATWGRMVRHAENYRISVKGTIRTLLQNGAHLSAPAMGGKGKLSALVQAIMHRSFDMVETVIDECPEMIHDPMGPAKEFPLHYAVLQDREDLVNLLLCKGADPLVRRYDGLNVLGHYASHRQRLSIPSILLQKGVNIEIPPSESGYAAPFFGAVKNRAFDLAIWILENTPEQKRGLMINALCFRSTNFNCPKPGVTILGYLIIENSILSLRAVRFLFSLEDTYGKLDFEAFPGQGKSALHYLASLPHHLRDNVANRALAMEVLKHFSSKEEIDLVNRLNGKTALWEAVRSLNYDMIDLLLEKGASPFIQAHNGQTPLALCSALLAHSEQHHKDQDILEKLEEIKSLFQSHGYSLPQGAG